MSLLRISVLITTYNRAFFLKDVLDSLMIQTLPKDQYEVVVIDDGSSDNTKEVVESFEKKLFIRYAYQENQGISVAKNYAIRLAKAPIIVFMDDDDIADARLLTEHLGTHKAYPDENIAVLGFTDLRKDVALSPLMHFVTQVGYYLFCYPKIKHGEMLDYTYFWGGRSSCKKNLLLKNGMFDPIFRFGCEDIELGYRLSAYNFRVVYNKNAHTTMIRTMSLDDFCQRVERQGYSNWIFSQKYPAPDVKLWADSMDIDVRWNMIGPQLEYFKKCASGLEKIVQARNKYGVEVDDLLTSLLNKAYWDVIDGYRIRGLWVGQKDRNTPTQLLRANSVTTLNTVKSMQSEYSLDHETTRRRLSKHILEDQPPWNNIPIEKSIIPGMITQEECHYYSYIGKFYKGIGEAIELGPWLGRSTFFILSGLIRNPNFLNRKLRIYDDFIWRTSWMNEYVPKPERIENHQDFQHMFDKYINASYRKYITVEKRKICNFDGNENIPQLVWDGKKIEIIYIDCGRTYEVNDAWYRLFSPSFIPGVTLIIMQDWGTFRETPSKWYNQTKLFTDSKGSQLELIHELKGGNLATFIYQR